MPDRLFHLFIPPYVYLFRGYFTLLCCVITSKNRIISNFDVCFPVRRSAKVIGEQDEPERRGRILDESNRPFSRFSLGILRGCAFNWSVSFACLLACRAWCVAVCMTAVCSSQLDVGSFFMRLEGQGRAPPPPSFLSHTDVRLCYWKYNPRLYGCPGPTPPGTAQPLSASIIF